MAERFIIVHRPTEPPVPKPDYDNLADAIAALDAIRKANPDETFELVRTDIDQATGVVSVRDIQDAASPQPEPVPLSGVGTTDPEA